MKADMTGYGDGVLFLTAIRLLDKYWVPHAEGDRNQT